MKIKEQYKIRKIGTDEVLVSGDATGLNYSRIIVLNPAAAFLLRETEHNSFTPGQWANLLVSRYGIDPVQALQDVEKMIDKLRNEMVLE
jgi:hypothetical protein